MSVKCFSAAILIAALLFICTAASAEEYDPEAEEDLSAEIERQIGGLDLASFDGYFDGLIGASDRKYSSMAELIGFFANSGAEDPESIFGAAAELLGINLKRSIGTICLLVAVSLLTSLNCLVSDEGVKKTLSVCLNLGACALVFGITVSLAGTAFRTVGEIAGLTEKTAPVNAVLMISTGCTLTAGIFSPLFVFLSGTVIKLISEAIMPLVFAGGVISLTEAFTESERLKGIVKLIRKTVKWSLGLISAVYCGITAVQGMRAAAADGVAIRTAKYAVEKLIPIAGGLVGSAADNVLGCALLIKNGFGAAVTLILFSIVMSPMTVLITGSFIFRITSALAGTAADPRAVKLMTNAAETVSELFACTAVPCLLFMVTTLAAAAAGGVTAGLW